MAGEVIPLQDTRAQPDCFTDEEWAAWCVAARSWFAKPPADHFACIDCTPEFKQQMLEEGRCSWPDVEFVVGEDGGIEGHRVFPIKRV
jgi:hypothetical protein